ncbi:MAG: hypothetical protein Q9174_002268 [Haloplaca sp. 1 TL-2023]
MSLPAESQIYTGPWINWSRGIVYGSTITLSQRDGSLLTAFLGIYVAAAGTAFWRIWSFLLHQHRAKPQMKDAVHHQQQAILRNSGSPDAAAWQLTQVAWKWRKTTPNSILRGLPIIILATCNIVLFAIAGVFSSEVTKAAGNETLIRSSDCGFLLQIFSDANVHVVDAIAGFQAMEANDTLVASAYTRACYRASFRGSQCYQLPQSSIAWTNRTVPCPFGDNICKDVGGFELDTGLLDSHRVLGINAKPSDRVQYRKVTTCSVLRTKEYSYYWNNTDTAGSGVQELIRYNYETWSKGSTNYTWQYNLNDVVGSYGYSLTPYAILRDVSDPIPALNRTDADVTIMFLAPNAVTYTSPVYDPLFRATLPYNITDFGGNNNTMYTSDHWAGVLACADQYQFHNPQSGKSTPLTSRTKLNDDLAAVGFNELQLSTVLSLYYTIGTSDTYYSVHSRGAASLRASDTVVGSDLNNVGLPDNQWTIEATEMFSISLAKLQQQILNYALGPPNLYQDMEFIKGSVDVCQRQKIRGIGGFLSFSILGVAIILIVGGLIILTSIFLDMIVGFIQRRFKWSDHKRLQWATDEKLQLQRLAYEEAGQGQWLGGTDAVPTTSKDQLLGFGLDTDRNHPRLARETYYNSQSLAVQDSESQTSGSSTADEKSKAAVAARAETGLS